MNLHSQDTSGRDRDEPVARSPIRSGQAVQAPQSDEIDLGGLIRIALAHKKTILLTTFLVTALAVAYVMNATPRYLATASLVLKSQEQNILDLESLTPGLSSDLQAMNTELLILESNSLLGQVVDELSLVEDPEFNRFFSAEPSGDEQTALGGLWSAIGWTSEPAPPPTPYEIRKEAIETLRNQLNVALVSLTYAIELSVEATSPEKAANIANKIADLYIASQVENKFSEMDDAMVWLGERVAELKEELEAAEENVRKYAAKATVITEEGLHLETEKLKRLREDLSAKERAGEELRERVARLEELRASGDFEGLSEYAALPQLRNLASGQDEAALRRFESLFDRRIQELRREIDRADRQVRSLEQGVATLESELEVRSSDFVRLQQLEREAEATRLIYEHSLARMKEISIQQGIQRPDARVLDPAEVPDHPSHPRTILTVMGGGFFGGLIGLFIVFMRSTMRTTLQSVDELEAASGVSTIGVIPETRARRPSALLKQMVDKPAAPLAEAIRNLRATIQLSNIDAPPQFVMVTSSVPGEGKSTVSASLAQAAALSGKRVLLIDADLRRRALREYYQVDKKPGLLSVLTGALSLDEAIWHDDATQLDVLFCEEGKATAGDVFGSHRFVAFLAEVRRLYDLVVIDTAPVLAVSDTRVIAQHADAIVYVVRWNSTEQKVLRAGLNTLWQVNADVTGVVLNRVKAAGSQQYGYYAYSYT